MDRKLDLIYSIEAVTNPLILKKCIPFMQSLRDKKQELVIYYETFPAYSTENVGTSKNL